MNRLTIAALGLVALLASANRAQAVIIAVDLDPSTVGVQTTLPGPLTVGDIFTVQVVAYDPSGAAFAFNSGIAQISYNLGGGAVAPLPGVSAGSFAAAPFTSDAGSGSFVAPGGALAPGPVPGVPLAGYGAATDLFGIFNIFGGFTGGSTPMSLFSMDFEATGVGDTDLVATGIAFFGLPSDVLSGTTAIPQTFEVSSITVQPRVSVVPEPGSLVVWGLGLLGAAALGVRRRKRATA